MLGVALYDVGEYAESEAVERKNLALIRRIHDGVSVRELQSVTDLATSIQAQSRLLEAQGMLGQALELGSELGEIADADVAYVRSLLSYIYFQRGYYAEALAEVNTALSVQERLYGGESMDLAVAHNNVGGLHY